MSDPDATLADHLRRALRYTTGNARLDTLLSGSLHAGIPESRPDLHCVYREETATDDE